MKYLLVILPLMALASCTATERGAAIGGAAVGGAVGAVAGALIGSANEPGRWYYRDRYGRRVVDDCPSEYRWHHRRY